MNDQWSWFPGHEQPANTNQRQPGQDLPSTTPESGGYGLSARHPSSALGHVEYVGSTYVPGHGTPISQYHNQVPTVMDADQASYSTVSQYLGSAQYGHIGPPHLNNGHGVSSPVLRARGYDGIELDDFGEHIDLSVSLGLLIDTASLRPTTSRHERATCRAFGIPATAHAAYCAARSQSNRRLVEEGVDAEDLCSPSQSYRWVRRRPPYSH